MNLHTCSYYCERPECVKAQRYADSHSLMAMEYQDAVNAGRI